jgi:hypothetical protein
MLNMSDMFEEEVFGLVDSKENLRYASNSWRDLVYDRENRWYHRLILN